MQLEGNINVRSEGEAMRTFISQYDFKSAKLRDYGCGVAALTMALSDWCSSRIIPSEEDLAQALWAHVTPTFKGFPEEYGYGVDYDDAIMFLRRLRIPYNHTAVSPENNDAYERIIKSALPAMIAQGPVMAAVSGNIRVWEGGHWIVLYEYTERNFFFCDPGYRRSDSKFKDELTVSEFKSYWTGYSVQPYGMSKTKRTWPPLEI